MTYDIYLWSRPNIASVTRGVAFLCVSGNIPCEGLGSIPEDALVSKIEARFGAEPPFELEMASQHVFVGLAHADAKTLTPWFESLACELSLEVFDPQVDGPSAADEKAFMAAEKIRAASALDDDVKRWRDDARRGDPLAMNELGNWFADGEGAEPDPVEAVRWFGMAANVGYVPALINLAECHRQGTGVPKDAGAAARLYELAYERDKCCSAFALGEMYRDGEGVPISIDRAEEYFIMARAHRHPEAYLALKRIGRTPKT